MMTTDQNPRGRGPMTKQEFGRRLRSLILEKGWNQSEFARRASAFLDKGVGRDSVSQYVNDRSFPGAAHLYAMARALDKDPADLLPGADRTPAPGAGAALEIRAVPGTPERVHVRIDQEVAADKAMRIWQILQEGD